MVGNMGRVMSTQHVGIRVQAIQRKTIGRHRQHGDTVQDALQVQIVNLVLDTPVSSSLEPVAHAALSLHSLCAAGQALG